MNKEKLFNLADTTLDNKVHIAGTNWDRRRKLTNKDIYEIKRMYKRGKAISVIASKYNVTSGTIKYHLFEDYKREVNQKRKEYIVNNNATPESRSERARYKRYLIDNNKRIAVR